MATVGSFLELMIRECGERRADGLLAQNWLQERYRSALERAPWPFLIKEATFNTVAEKTAGTVLVTLGSATVTEVTSNANGWTSAVEGRYFRRDGDSEFYEINTFTDANPDTLTLNRVYEGNTSTSAEYVIFQRFYSLASDCRTVLSMAVIDSPRPMLEVSQGEMDFGLTNRSAVGSPPTYWANAGRDASDIARVELYPIPDEAHGILYHYIQATPSIADADASIMAPVNHSLLRAGWMSNYWAWRAGLEGENPSKCLEMSQRFEAEFERRLTEMVMRECPNWPPQRIKFMPRYWQRRRGKFDAGRANLLLSDD